MSARVVLIFLLAFLLSPVSASADPAIVRSVAAPGDTVPAFGYDWSLALQRDSDGLMNTSILGTKKGVEAYRIPLEIGSGALVWAELDGDPKSGPELVFVPDPQGSGAHVEGILWMTAAGTFVELGFNGTGGVVIQDADGDGVAEIVTGIYLGWGSNASAARPVWVLALRDGGLRDVTSKHPMLLKAEVDALQPRLDSMLVDPRCGDDEQVAVLADLATYGAYAALQTLGRAQAMRIWGANNPCIAGFEAVKRIEASLENERKNLKAPTGR